jgi:hypothetical protein
MEHLRPFTSKESAHSRAQAMGLENYRVDTRSEPFLTAAANGAREWVPNTYYVIVYDETTSS